MSKLKLLVAVFAVALMAPGLAHGANARGIVVARGHGTLLVATHSGRVVQVKGHAAIGSRIVGHRVVGHARHARIHGVVVKQKGSTLFVACNHHLLALHIGRRLAGSGPAGTPPGTVITSTVTVHKNGELDQEDQTEVGEDNDNTIQVQATVAAVGAGTITLTVNGQNLVVELPGGLTLPQSLVGQTVAINVSLSQNDDNQGDDDQGDDDQGDVSGSVSAPDG